MNTSFAAKIAGRSMASVLVLSAIVLGGTTIAAAQSQTSIAPASCVTLTHALYLGSRDATTSGDVTTLQDFLAAQGDLQVSATGYFGVLTLRAAEQFQASQGVAAIGYIGPLTRAAIQRTSCGGNMPVPTNSPVSVYSISPSSGPIGTTVSVTGFGFTDDNTINFGPGVIMHVPITSRIAVACTTDPSCRGGIRETLVFTVPQSLDPACRFTTPQCEIVSRMTTPGTYSVSVSNTAGTSNATAYTVTAQGSSPSIASINPASGAAGTLITLNGSGFTGSDDVMIGGGAISNLSVGANGAQLSFTLPDGVGAYCAPGMACPMYFRLLTPGPYQISVKDVSSGNMSNSVGFTITSGTSGGGTLSVSGLDAPTTLALGSTGTWTVHVNAPSDLPGNLHYSVVWGDEAQFANASIMMPQPTTVQSSASFTHTYQRSGTYTPTFTVTDDSGRSVTTSATVTVTPLY